MRHLILASIIAAMLLGIGVYHGLATDRWSNPAAADSPGKPFANMSLTLGDWKGEVLPRDAEDDSKTSVINMRYTHAVSGRWVVTSLTSGRSGRVAIHNPEHCYLGNGYKVVDSIREESIEAGGQVQQFWTGHFEKKKPTGVESIRIYWGWTLDGRWQAPSYPRLFFAGKAKLHKLYVIHAVPVGTEVEDEAPYKEFLALYLTELDRRLGH
jgi:hypothetical protein